MRVGREALVSIGGSTQYPDLSVSQPPFVSVHGSTAHLRTTLATLAWRPALDPVFTQTALPVKAVFSSSPVSTTSDFFGVHTSLPLLLLFCSLLWLAAPRALFFLEIFQSSPGFSSSPFFHWSITFTTVSQTHSIQLTSVFPLSLLVNS